jgi:flagellin
LAPEEDKTLTFTSGVGGSASNNITITITVAVNDTLALSKSGNAVTVALANATGSKNSAANIQTALRALSTVGDIDVSAATVTSNTAYTNTPSTGLTAGTEAEVTLTPETGKVLTIGSGYAGSLYNNLSFVMDTAENDTLAVAESGGVITISLADTTASNNAASAIQTAVRALSVSGYVMTAFTVDGNPAYDAEPPITADIEATAMAGGNEVAVAATNLAGGDLTRIQVVAKG